MGQNIFISFLWNMAGLGLFTENRLNFQHGFEVKGKVEGQIFQGWDQNQNNLKVQELCTTNLGRFFCKIMIKPFPIPCPAAFLHFVNRTDWKRL